MNGQDRKRIVRNSASNINVLAEFLLKAVIAERISELKNYKDSLREDKEKKGVTRKIEILQQPFEHEFYQNIREKAVKAALAHLSQIQELLLTGSFFCAKMKPISYFGGCFYG